MKLFLFIVGMLILAVVSNPSDQRHLDAFKASFRDAWEKETGEDVLDDEEIEQALDSGYYVMDQAWVNKMIRPLVTIDDYILFSVSRTSLGGSIIGIGAFGIVWTKKLPQLIGPVSKPHGQSGTK
jgi:hypothetical protein